MAVSTWWLIAHFAATESAVIGIPVDEIDSAWERASVLTIERVVREVEGVSPAELAGVRFDAEADLDADGTDERVVAGVFEDSAGVSGSFLLVATGSDAEGWRRVYLCEEAGAENLSAVVVEGREVHWFDRLHCDGSAVLRHESGRYTLGDSVAAAYTGECR